MGQQPNQNQSAYPALHQQILALTTSPYGDNALFKDLKASGVTEESLKPTNPAAQKAILDSTSKQFKVSPKVGSQIKIKPLGAGTTKVRRSFFISFSGVTVTENGMQLFCVT